MLVVKGINPETFNPGHRLFVPVSFDGDVHIQDQWLKGVKYRNQYHVTGPMGLRKDLHIAVRSANDTVYRVSITPQQFTGNSRNLGFNIGGNREHVYFEENGSTIGDSTSTVIPVSNQPDNSVVLRPGLMFQCSENDPVVCVRPLYVEDKIRYVIATGAENLSHVAWGEDEKAVIAELTQRFQTKISKKEFGVVKPKTENVNLCSAIPLIDSDFEYTTEDRLGKLDCTIGRPFKIVLGAQTRERPKTLGFFARVYREDKDGAVIYGIDSQGNNFMAVIKLNNFDATHRNILNSTVDLDIAASNCEVLTESGDHACSNGNVKLPLSRLSASADPKLYRLFPGLQIKLPDGNTMYLRISAEDIDRDINSVALLLERGDLKQIKRDFGAVVMAGDGTGSTKVRQISIDSRDFNRCLDTLTAVIREHDTAFRSYNLSRFRIK